MQNVLVDNAKVMAKGQITLPKDIREALGVKTGDRVTLISQDNQVIMMNSAVYAMKMLQSSMEPLVLTKPTFTASEKALLMSIPTSSITRVMTLFLAHGAGLTLLTYPLSQVTCLLR